MVPPEQSRRPFRTDFILIVLLTFCALFYQNQALAIDPPFLLPQNSELSRVKSAVVLTSKGKMTFELFPEEAPWHVANFKYLADRGFYRGRAFHIMIDDFIVQGGRHNDSQFRYTLPAEFNQHKHQFGSLGMARAPDYVNPARSSSSTQFHILLTQAKNMDGSYTIFGNLVDGSEVLESLKRNDKILDITVYVEDENSPPPQLSRESRESQQESWLVSSLRN